MASEKNINAKKAIVDEIKKKIDASESVILFTYQGLTVSDLSSLRIKLKECDSDLKVYKNTLVKRALDDKNISFDGFLEGPNAILFGKELLEPIKILSDFAKNNKQVEIKIGIISGDVAGLDTIKEYASIPSREGLLTMLAGGMIQYVKDLSIALNLYAENLEK